ncbi:MAG: DUF481 domain-containing protein [Bdellovibrionales bacterium]
MQHHQLPLTQAYKRFLVCTSSALGLLTLFAVPAMAEPAASRMTVRANIKQEATWSSNPLLAVNGGKALWGSTTSPELVFKSITPKLQFNANARIDENVFNQSSHDSTDIILSSNISKNNQRWSVALRSGINYDTTRTSELTNYDLVQVDRHHLGLSIGPRVSFSPSPVDTISLSGLVQASRYEGDAFTNYNTYTVSPSYARQFDPNNSGNVSVQIYRYQTTRNNASRKDSWSPSFGWQTTLTPRLSANASVGAQASRQYIYGISTTSWTWNTVFSGGLSYKGEQDNLSFSASRSNSSYGNGTDALQTSFSIMDSHKINPRVSLSFGAGYLTSEYEATVVGSMESMTNGNLGITYRLTDDFNLTANYKYRYETLVNRSQSVQDHAVTIGLTFHPDGWTL